MTQPGPTPPTDPFQGQPSYQGPQQGYPQQGYPQQQGYPPQPAPGMQTWGAQPYGAPRPQAGPRPGAATAAVWLTVLGGVLMLISFIVSAVVTATGDTRDELITDLTTGPDPMSYSAAEGTILVAVVLVVVLGAVLAAVWWGLAAFLARGRGWARITATVLATLAGVVMICGALGLLIDTTGWESVILSALSTVCGIAAVVLLWLPASSRWFEAKALERG